MLTARGLRKSYGKVVAVSDVSVTVAEGEIVGLLGPNGAGKSTTVAMLCGISTPDAGEVTVNGVSVNGRGQAGKALVGLVPQDLALIDELPALDNILLFGSLYGMSGALLKSRAHEALELVGLSDRAKSLPPTFSGGMKRRLNIACALVHDPKVLMLDEPTVGIDPQSRNLIFENLDTLRSRGKALLYTTHYMEEVERLCDRIVIIDHGRVVAEGTKESLRALMPPTAASRYEITGVIDAELLADLQTRGIESKLKDEASLEKVFLHLTGTDMRDTK